GAHRAGVGCQDQRQEPYLAADAEVRVQPRRRRAGGPAAVRGRGDPACLHDRRGGRGPGCVPGQARPGLGGLPLVLLTQPPSAGPEAYKSGTLPGQGTLPPRQDPTGGPAPRHGRWPAMEGMQNESLVVATPPQPGHYEIDPSQSRVTFTTRHLFGLGRVKGSFAIRRGSADVADPVAASAIYPEIETASVRAHTSQ